MCLLKTAGKTIPRSRHRDEMDMIGHQAVADQLYTVTLDALKQQIEIDTALGVGFEDETLGVTALRNVMCDFESDDTCESHHFHDLFAVIAVLAVQRLEITRAIAQPSPQTIINLMDEGSAFGKIKWPSG